MLQTLSLVNTVSVKVSFLGFGEKDFDKVTIAVNHDCWWDKNILIEQRFLNFFSCAAFGISH